MYLYTQYILRTRTYVYGRKQCPPCPPCPPRIILGLSTMTNTTQYIPFVTASLTIHHVDASLVPHADVSAILIGTTPAYRLTPDVYAHLHHACERLLSRPIATRPDDDASTRVLHAIESVYAALLTSGVDPATIPQWSANLPSLPQIEPFPDVPDFPPSTPYVMLTPHDANTTTHAPNTTTPALPTRTYDTRPTSAKRTTTRNTKRSQPQPSTPSHTLFDDSERT